MTVAPLRERLIAKMVMMPNGCIEWSGYCHKTLGYGIAHDGGRKQLAHRLVYTTFVGPIPDGLVLHHTCENPPCVVHLVPVTQAVNILLGNSPWAVRARQTHCIRNHQLPPHELGRQRSCGECHRLREQVRRRGGTGLDLLPASVLRSWT